MREILFRGYSKEDNQWHYGYICKSAFETIVIQDIETGSKYLIDIDSIGQYTGFKDKNGKEIYEGDIIKTEKDKELCQVIFDEYSGMWKLRDLNTYMGVKFSWYKCEVIGNTYEDKLKEDK